MSLGLLGAYQSSSSSSSSSEGEQEENNREEEKKRPLLSNPFGGGGSSTLPKPSFMQDTKDFKTNPAHSAASSTSVFSNPFKVKEEKKTAILEKHVAMTTRQEERKTIDGKKVCWNFRKGRCRFGHKCSFAHDSDVNLRKPEPTPNAFLSGKSDKDVTSSSSSSVQAVSKAKALPPDEPYDAGAVIEGEGGMSNKAKKKRPGLSEGLVPGKKAMKFHNRVYNAGT